MRTSFFIILLLAAYACNSEDDKYPKAENAFDAGREFIDGCLKGDFNKAAFYMVNDGENSKHLLQIKNDYNVKTVVQKEQYREASIVVNQDEAVSDTVHIINYMNSYDKIARKIKVVSRAGAWQVDFKYTFNGNL
jgi:hypothetical protein